MILIAFLLVVTMVVLTWDTPGLPSWLTLAALFGALLLAGLSGALVRGVWETAIQGLPHTALAQPREADRAQPGAVPGVLRDAQPPYSMVRARSATGANRK